jgi:hypothetical protein
VIRVAKISPSIPEWYPIGVLDLVIEFALGPLWNAPRVVLVAEELEGELRLDIEPPN